MHRSLLLPDVFKRILDYLEILPSGDFYSGYDQEKDQNASIARLARTCRAFLEPSLDVLWKHQLTLCPLLKTLPADAWEEIVEHIVSSNPRRGFAIYLLRPLIESDFSRVDFYASRIKALGYYANEFADEEWLSWCTPNYSSPEREPRPIVISQLCLYRRGRWLLPNLTHLRWNIYNTSYTEYAPMFLGPNLRCLSFAFYPATLIPPLNPAKTQNEVLRVLSALVQLCPTVRELEIFPEYAEDVVVATRGFARDCPRLEGYQVNTVEHPPIDWDFLKYLAEKPELRKFMLTVSSETAEYLPILSSPPIYHPFPSLQVLEIRIPRLPLCIPLFAAMQHCRLFSLLLEVEYQPSAADVVNLFDTLRTHCAKHTLHVFRVDQRMLILEEDVFPPHKEDHLVDIVVLSMMFYFPNLRVFVLCLPLYGWLTDEDLRAVGIAWPGLIVFSFGETFGNPGVIVPATWEGLASLVSLCPLLTHLNLVFDTTRNLDVAYAYTSRPGTQLRYIDIIDSILPEDPGVFARALFSIAPRIVSFKLFEHGVRWDPHSDPNAPLSYDPYAYRNQVDMIMCRLRREHFGEEYTADIIGAKEIDEALDSQPQEWNPRSQR